MALSLAKHLLTIWRWSLRVQGWDICPPTPTVLNIGQFIEQYGYHHRNAIDLGAVMPAIEFRVTNEAGTYLCMVRALIFEGSILGYDPTRDEVEWVPARWVANDLSWAEERMAVMLVNFVPHTPQEADCIVELRTHCLLAWTDDSSLEEEGKQMQEEGDEPKEDKCKEVEGCGGQTPKHCLVMRNADRARLNQRWSHKDDHGSGHP